MSSKIHDDMRDVMRRRYYSIRTERSLPAIGFPSGEAGGRRGNLSYWYNFQGLFCRLFRQKGRGFILPR